MFDDSQQVLFHEDIYEAIRTVVMRLGGSKKVAGLLWPEKSPSQAGELLNNCLNTARPEKLELQRQVVKASHDFSVMIRRLEQLANG